MLSSPMSQKELGSLIRSLQRVFVASSLVVFDQPPERRKAFIEGRASLLLALR